MNSVNRPNRILTFTALGTAILALALRLICVLFFYDTAIGYYTAGAVLPVISNITLVLSAVALIVLAFLKAPADHAVSAPSGLSRWSALIPALALAIRAVQLIGGGMSESSLTHILSLIGALAGAGFFCCLAFVERPSGITVVLGTGFVLFLAVAWASSYTDFTVAMNSPDKRLFNLACVGAALFTVGELRAVYDRARTRVYYCYVSLALLTLAAGPTVAFIGDLLGRYSGNAARGEDLALVAVMIYALVRLLTLAHSPIKEEYCEAEALDSYYDYEEEFCEEAEEAAETDNANEESTSDEN